MMSDAKRQYDAQYDAAPAGKPATNIRIRGARQSDGEAISEITSCPGVVWGTLNLTQMSADMWPRALGQLADGCYVLVAEVDGKVVGQAELVGNPRVPRRGHACTIGVCVHDDWQGRGIGRAMMKELVNMAENWLNMQRVELTVWVDNTGAIKLYEELGFVTEGRLRGYLFRDGKLVDAYTMAKIREGTRLQPLES
jgi:putative acetyltransferase